MALATMLVAVVPVLAVWLLRSAGALSSPWMGLGLAIALSTVLSSAGCAYWKRQTGSGDLLFSELLVWGWVRRWRVQRQLTNAVQLLGLQPSEAEGPSGGSPASHQERLLRQVAVALEAEDPYTRGHSQRVARHAASIARKMGLSKREVDRIREAALVHDVGKLRVPSEVLNKPTRLTDTEFALIKRHPVDGAQMVAGLRHGELTAIVRHHHERLDGKGYPDGLAGDQIPLGSRIIAVADTFDAITSARPYRPASEHKKAFDILAEEQGRQLDRDAVRAFLACYAGRRSSAVWSIVTLALQRGVASLSGQASAATITTGSVMAAAAATAAIGGVAMTPAMLAGTHTARTADAVRSLARPPAQARPGDHPAGVAFLGLGAASRSAVTAGGTHKSPRTNPSALADGRHHAHRPAGGFSPAIAGRGVGAGGHGTYGSQTLVATGRGAGRHRVPGAGAGPGRGIRVESKAGSAISKRPSRGRTPSRGSAGGRGGGSHASGGTRVSGGSHGSAGPQAGGGGQAALRDSQSSGR